MTHPTLTAMARAAAEANGERFDTLPVDFVWARDGEGPEAMTQKDYREIALAALRALAEREPSKGMLQAVAGPLPRDAEVYRAMLAALVEECERDAG